MALPGFDPDSLALKLELLCYASHPEFCFLGCRVGARGTGKNGDGNILLRRFNSPREAGDFARDNGRALIEQARERCRLPALHGPGEERRTPTARADDVSEEQFKAVFRPRELRFGPSLARSDRQRLLNRTFDALDRLAGVLGVAADRLFLSGRLSIALGEGGKRGAHYQANADKLVVPGASTNGNLAYEWFRAFDRMAGKRAGVLIAGGYLSEAAVRGKIPAPRRPAGKPPDDVLQDWSRRIYRIRRIQRFYDKAFGSRSKVRRRAAILDGYRSTPNWSAARRMAARAFETCVGAAMAERGHEDSLLVRRDRRQAWEEWAKLARIPADDGHPYLNEAEEASYRKALFAMVGDWLPAEAAHNQKPSGVAEPAPEF